MFFFFFNLHEQKLIFAQFTSIDGLYGDLTAWECEHFQKQGRPVWFVLSKAIKQLFTKIKDDWVNVITKKDFLCSENPEGGSAHSLCGK